MKTNRRRISPISDTKKKVNTEYAKLKRVWWGEGRKCEFPGCRKMAEKQPHHSAGRSGRLLCDSRHWKALCIRHHMWIDWHRNEAREMGLLCPWGLWNDFERMNQYYLKHHD